MSLLNNITIFDFETSGLDPQNCRVIELAAIRCVNGEIVSQFNTLVRHDIQLSPKITEVTGITTDLMRQGMTEEIAFKILRSIMGSSTLVAHNAAFDLQFLHHTMMRLANKSFTNPFIDTLTISRDRHYYPHKLTDMCERYKIELTGAHRALNDVLGTWELLKAFEDEDGIGNYLNQLGYLKKYGPPEWAPEYAKLVPVENRYEPRTAG